MTVSVGNFAVCLDREMKKGKKVFLPVPHCDLLLSKPCNRYDVLYVNVSLPCARAICEVYAKNCGGEILECYKEPNKNLLC